MNEDRQRMEGREQAVSESKKEEKRPDKEMKGFRFLLKKKNIIKYVRLLFFAFFLSFFFLDSMEKCKKNVTSL